MVTEAQIIVSGLLHWKCDEWGNAARALYVGGLYVGGVTRLQRSRNIDKFNWGFRAWLMTDEDGEDIDWFETEQEAQEALIAAAIARLDWAMITGGRAR